MSNSGTKRRAGFTLVELLVVIAIIGVLVGMLLPAVQAAREAGRRSSCQNNLRQFAIAMQNYHDTHTVFPRGGYLSGTSVTPYTAYHHTWITSLLPFMEQKPLHDMINFNLPIIHSSQSFSGKPLMGQDVKLFHCPSDAGFRQSSETLNMAVTNYAGSEGLSWFSSAQVFNPSVSGGPPLPNSKNGKKVDYTGIFGVNRTMDMSNLKDGGSNTVIIAEVDSFGFDNGTSYVNGQGDRNVAVDAVFRAAFVFAAYNGDAASNPYKQADGSDANPGNFLYPSQTPHPFSPTFIAQYGLNNYWPGASSMHSGGIIQAARGDGSVGQYRENMSWAVWAALNGVADGVPVQE